MLDEMAGEPEGEAHAVPGRAPELPGVPEAPVTGDPAVDAAVALLSDVIRQPLEAQPAGYEHVHRTLTDRLADVEG